MKSINDVLVIPLETRVKKNAAVMVNADTLFTTSGDVLVTSLISECYTANGATASTLQYQVVSPNGTATISGTSASLANAAVGVSVVLQPPTLTTAPTVTAAAGVSAVTSGGIRVPGGSSIKIVVGVGSTTGTWKHYITYQPLETGAFVQ